MERERERERGKMQRKPKNNSRRGMIVGQRETDAQSPSFLVAEIERRKQMQIKEMYM